MAHGGGSLSHQKHRSTGGPRGVNRGRRNPAAAMELARLMNAEAERRKLPAEMYDSVRVLFDETAGRRPT